MKDAEFMATCFVGQLPKHRIPVLTQAGLLKSIKTCVSTQFFRYPRKTANILVEIIIPKTGKIRRAKKGFQKKAIKQGNSRTPEGKSTKKRP